MTLVAERQIAVPSTQFFRQGPTGEVVVFCPQCKALQTVQIIDSKLTPTRKFTQQGGNIYHDCGSTKPCRLYHNL